jgi:hypothetical protein
MDTTKREIIETLAQTNPILHSALMLAYKNEKDWTEALEIAVIALANSNKNLENLIQEYFMNRSPEPRIINDHKTF